MSAMQCSKPLNINTKTPKTITKIEPVFLYNSTLKYIQIPQPILSNKNSCQLFVSLFNQRFSQTLFLVL